MKKITITNVTFDQAVKPAILKKFRGAVIEHVLSQKQVFASAEIATTVFHNHVEQVAVAADDEEMVLPEKGGKGRYYHYPMIQYQLRHGKAAMTGIGPGAQALQFWMALAPDELQVHQKPFSLEVAEHHHSHWEPQIGNELHTYRINKWLAFNAANHDEWKRTLRLHDKAQLLDKRLWGHLCHLCDSLDIVLDKEKLELFVSTIDHQCYRDCYGIQKLALDITFQTNLNLPSEIGLGQGTTIGFGKVQGITSKQQPQKRKVNFRKGSGAEE